MTAEFRLRLLEAMRKQDAALVVDLAMDTGVALAWAKTSAATAKLDRDLELASAYGQGLIVGSNADARAACADGLVGDKSRALVAAEGQVMTLTAQFDAIKFAVRLLTMGEDQA